MQINEYQDEAAKTAIYPFKNTSMGLSYAVLGLASEAGEVAGKLKKILRDDFGIMTEEKRKAMIAEVGDVCWYIAATATELGVDLESVMVQNIEKLRLRATNNTLKGDGDNR